MSSTATLTDTNASVSANVRPEVATYALVAFVTPDGTNVDGSAKSKTDLKVVTSSKDIDEIKKKADPNTAILIEQTFGYVKPVTLDGIAESIPDEAERIVIFNAGLKQRFMSKSIQQLKELDDEGNPAFQPVEGTFDMQSILNEPLQKRNLSPMDKLEKSLRATLPGMPDAFYANFLANVKAQQSASQQPQVG